MVTRFTTPFQVTAPTTNVDVQLLDNTLSFKQQNFDQGFLQISKTLEAYNSMDLIKPEDIEYRNKKVEALTEKLNNYGNVDLSDVKEVAKLQTEAASLSKDKDLIGKVQSTRNYRQLVDRYAKMKENPKLIKYYSQVNEYNDMVEANKWLNGQSERMPISSPTLAVDKDGLAAEQLKLLKPTTYSYTNGLYKIDGEVTSENDLQHIAYNQLSSNPDIQGQLQRDARFLYRDATPQQVYEKAMQNAVDDISGKRASLLAYQNQLKDGSVTAEEKASINSKLTALEGSIQNAEASYQDLSQRYTKGDASDLDNLKYSIVANNWVKGVVKPYIIQREKRTADTAQMFLRKEAGDAAELQMKQAFTEQENNKDRKLKTDLELIQAQAAMSKTGDVPDIEHYRATGEFRLMPNNTGVGPSAFYQLPALQQDGEINAFTEINTKSQAYKNENKQLVSQLTKDILKGTDRDLLAQIKPLLDTGNLFDNKTGKYLGDSKGISQAQIMLLKQYDDLLDNAINPEAIKNNPLLSKYGTYQNKMIENQVKWQSLDNEKARVEKEVFNEAWKNGEFKGTWNDFQSIIKGEVTSSAKMIGRPESDISGAERVALGMGNSVFKNDYETGKFTKRITEKLNTSPHKNEFLTAKAVAPEDKVYNDKASPMYTRVKDLGFKNGVLIGGQSYSLNGSIQEGKSFRDNLEGVEEIVVRGIVPNSNRLEVDIMQRLDPEKKELTSKRATIQLNPDEMEGIIGKRKVSETESFSQFMKNGRMVDGTGKQMYFNLNGDIPDMMGNIQYTFHSFDEDELLMSMKLPTSNGIVDVNIPNEFKGPNALQEGKAFLIDAFNTTFKSLKSINPTMSDEDTSKETLKLIYSRYSK